MSQRFPLITSETAISILKGEQYVSLDLGLTFNQIKKLDSKYMLTEKDRIETTDLEKISQDDKSIYFIQHNKIFMAAIAGTHYYKLVRTEGAPTLEIDGIRMHRTKNTTPEKDANEKLILLGVSEGRVLDTCMGLGYTAIQAHEKGASYVISLEFDPNVIRIAKLNSYSFKLFDENTIHKIIGDSYFILDAFPSNHFDYIIHDPPRHGSAGHLYGLEFYRKLAKVIKNNGRLFHYTGEPGSKYRRVNIRKGVSERLLQAGFSNLEYHPNVMGITCTRNTAQAKSP